MSDANWGRWLAVVALLMWSTSIVLTKTAVTLIRVDIGFTVAAVVNVIVGTVLVLGRLVLSSAPVAFDAYGFMAFVLVGFLNSYLGRAFYIDAVAKLGASQASAFISSSPVFATLFGWMWLDERLGFDRIAAIAITLLGLAAVSGSTDSAKRLSDSAKALARWWWLGLASAIAYGVGTAMRGVGVRHWPEPLLGALIGAIVGVLVHALVQAYRSVPLWPGWGEVDRNGIALFTMVGALGIGAQAISIVAMQLAPVADIALITAATPLVVWPLMRILYPGREPVNFTAVVGLLMSLLGVAYILLS